MKKSKTFYKIFIPILVLGISLVASFGSYIYFSTIGSVVDRLADSKQSLIVQVKNTLEQKIQTVEYAFSTYSTTKSFSDIVNNPISADDFEAYREINSQLNYIATMGPEGVNYSLISLEQDWQISGGSLSRLTKEERAKLYDLYIDDQGQSLFWVKTDDGIRFVHTLPVFTKNKQAIALSDISEQTLNELLQAKDSMPIYMFNKQGDVLYASDTGSRNLTPEQLKDAFAMQGAEEDSGKLTIPGAGSSSVTALYAKSDYNGWTYMTLLEKQEVTEALQTARAGITVMGLVLMLLITVVAYMLAVYFTKPFQKIRSSLAGISHPAASDDVDWIIRSIDSIVLEKESMENFIRSEMPKLESQFVLNLLRNRVSEEEARIGMERFGYPGLKDGKFAAMLVQLDNYGGRQSADKDVLLLAVSKIAGEVIPPSERMVPVLLNERTQATILYFDKSQSGPDIRKQVMQHAKSVIQASRKYLELSVSVGVSDIYGNALDSKEAVEMSMSALHHRLNLGKESIIFYGDISTLIPAPSLLHYPTELEARLFDAIRLGDEQEVSRSLYPLLANMMKHGKNTLNFEVTLIRFVNNLIQLEQLIGAEVLLTENNATLYHRLLDIRNPEEIERLLVEEVIRPMVRSMKEKTTLQFRSIADNIAAIVRSEFDQELSLEGIGERLHYSPNYLSSIFKKEYGKTFSDYLMNYRLEVAKKWLVETDMAIKDIAEKLRYQNPQNFIRSFRKKEHVTPGAYRKSKLDL